MKFSTKADTLKRLKDQLNNGEVLPLISFTVSDWQQKQEAILKEVVALNWERTPLIIRSSSKAEDNQIESYAGHFLSVANCKGLEMTKDGIERVIASYADKSRDNEVFIQPMLQNVIMSGVVFTLDPNTGSHYYVVNYDDTSGETDTVTSGTSNDLKVFYSYKKSEKVESVLLKKVIDLSKELEVIFNNDSLDIEFAFDDKEVLYLFQVRPLIINNTKEIEISSLENALKDIENKVEEGFKPHPYLYGEKNLYGVMPDWNPAEIIGIRPRPLALSLYKEIITDNIWAYQRDNYGYLNLRSFPLLLSFHGLPYIDVRVSFNSFIPADIDSDMANRLVNYYLEKLRSMPSHHDKVEFEIIYSCYTLDLPDRIKELRNHGFSQKEIEEISESLRKLTNKIIHPDEGLWKSDIAKIKILEERRDTILNSSLDKISKVYWLLEDCKRYGTLPFAGLARAGFIAVQMLKSLVEVGIFSLEEYNGFISSLDSISTQLSVDFQNLKKESFLDKYGHLRPGTYDILSPRYDEAPERYFNWNEESNNSHAKVDFVLSLNQLNEIDRLMQAHRLDNDLLGYFEFLKSAIEGREYSKFVFTKSLSETLLIIKSLCSEHGLSLDDASFIDINVFRELYSSSLNVKEVLTQAIETGKKKYKVSQSILLPSLIAEPSDIWSFHLPSLEPNFITLKKVVAPIVTESEDKEEFKDCILFINNADPGYDWIFSQGIVGFITVYGGMNSHMAIRAGELGIPAIIGCGEALSSNLKNANLLEMDCLNKRVKILK